MVSVQFSLGQFANGYCWTGPQQYGNDLVALLTGQIAGNFAGVIISATPPANTDQDKLWVKTDANGLPIGIFLYQGTWVWPNPRPPSTGERIVWSDTLANLYSFDGGDGTDPNTTAPTLTTGSMWIADTAFGFKIPVGAGTNGQTYDGNPAATINQGQAGGEERHVLTPTEQPVHHHGVANTDAGVARSIDFITPSSPVAIASTSSNRWVYDDPPSQTPTITAADHITSEAILTANATASHQNMPPFLGVYFAKRTARKFYTAS